MPDEQTATPPTAPRIPVDSYTEKIMCDFGHAFFSRDALLIPFRNQRGVSLGECMYIDEVKEAQQSVDSTPALGFFQACPVCKIIHLDGFSRVTTTETPGESDVTVPERNIELGL